MPEPIAVREDNEMSEVEKLARLVRYIIITMLVIVALSFVAGVVSAVL